jgi:Ferritin-like
MAIENLESLRRHLQWALQVELERCRPYLCALYSIKQGSNGEATEVVRSVFMEEMLAVCRRLVSGAQHAHQSAKPRLP